ncbi:heme/copper-type cytochrome/quinol oxidase subunit 2 [Paenibacillus sp. PvR052]|nr:heme/copper-type cytochrome/quinol oxidase subunit 2 [Paenibacillus sp. PvP091]MBP1169881.1 heme/copper-type cytochrome/quinol oxidase subunit 2 [Paenibacillus sp. PvR098]MBP2440909.1 heme/copper-type cytochrome/quinol oxidase subunit 2 [Paenibacillus sp. PvP052]
MVNTIIAISVIIALIISGLTIYVTYKAYSRKYD